MKSLIFLAMSNKPKNTDNIKLACQSLEKALNSFENENSTKPTDEQKSIIEMKETLQRIKKQIEKLS